MAILSILYISAVIVLSVSALACFAIYRIDKNAEKIEKGN